MDSEVFHVGSDEDIPQTVEIDSRGVETEKKNLQVCQTGYE